MRARTMSIRAVPVLVVLALAAAGCAAAGPAGGYFPSPKDPSTVRVRALALTLSASFSAGGALVPGVGLVDFLANPLAVRAFSRHQEMIADQKAVEILYDMGYRAPRRTLAEAIVAVARARPKPKEVLGG